MRIESVTISNFRSFGSTPTRITLADYTCLVGPNGSGKSNVLQALNVFFRHGPTGELASLTLDDFHCRVTSAPISIQVTFSDLSAAAQDDFKHYFRQGKLVVSAEARFDPSTGSADIKQFGSRMGMPEFEGFFAAAKSSAKVGELKAMYAAYKATFPDLPAAATKDAMAEALMSYEEANHSRCKPLPSNDEFYGFTRGANLLEKYIQWEYVPAVKDASAEQVEARATAFGRLLARAVRSRVNFEAQIDAIRQSAREKYRALLDSNQSVLSTLAGSLCTRLQNWAHPLAALELRWRDDDKAIRIEEPLAHVLARESDFVGEVSRLGHGVQRCYLLALLQELAGCDDPAGPRLILACEEPELYQHPPQARHMAAVFQDLGTRNSQVIVSTHSPYLIQGENLGSVRMLRLDDSGCTGVFSAEPTEIACAIAAARGARPLTPEGVLAKINQELRPEASEIFFTRRLVLVEGVEDRAYLTTYLILSGLWEQFRARGCHIVPTDGKSAMIYVLAVANALRIPTLAVFDGDRDKPDKNGSKKKHQMDNTALMKLSGVVDVTEPFPERLMLDVRAVVWPDEIAASVRAEIGISDWQRFDEKARQSFGHPGGLKKNMLHIAACLELAWQENRKSASLLRLCERIAAEDWPAPAARASAALSDP